MMSAMACWLPSLCQTPFFRAGFEMAAYGREVKVDEEAAWPLGEEPLVCNQQQQARAKTSTNIQRILDVQLYRDADLSTSYPDGAFSEPRMRQNPNAKHSKSPHARNI